MNHFSYGLGGGSILQKANASPSQMMSYLLTAPDGQLIMIDGGMPDDADALFQLLQGRHLSAWLFTHGHHDHIGAFVQLLQENRLPEIDCLYFAFPPQEWVEQTAEWKAFAKANPGARDITHTLQEGLCGRQTVHIVRGMEIFIGGLRIQVLRDISGCADYHSSINAYSVIYKVYYPRKSVLFLGDLSADASAEVLNSCENDLRCDIVQMAHHGQKGATREVYQAAHPKVCLWPTPDWLWNNDLGDGLNSGPYETLQTRAWMKALGVKKHLVMAKGDWLLD